MLTMLEVPAHWGRICIASDIHLCAADAQTAALWHRALADCRADALLLLGDYFDLWVGDDALGASASDAAVHDQIRFWRQAVQELAAASAQRSVYWMAGNRDFLCGPEFDQASGVVRLADPLLLRWGAQTYLLSHGDAWCSDDTDYMAFRARVRASDWQQQFLAQPLAERLRQADAMRQRSRQHQAQQMAPSDVNDYTLNAARLEAQAATVIHGHTHQGRSVALASGHWRHVTLDWCANSTPQRAEWLVLTAQGVHRESLTAP